MRIENAVKNFAILRRIAHNLLKLDNTNKKSLPMKQMRAIADDNYRNLLLSLARWPCDPGTILLVILYLMSMLVAMIIEIFNPFVDLELSVVASRV